MGVYYTTDQGELDGFPVENVGGIAHQPGTGIGCFLNNHAKPCMPTQAIIIVLKNQAVLRSINCYYKPNKTSIFSQALLR